jgi:predicted RNA-binding protein with RPS1 domain
LWEDIKSQISLSQAGMGGEAAKERRRLKRLDPSDGVPTPPGQKLIDNMGDAPRQPKVVGENTGADAVRLRLQRKMARKASGKFKSQAQTIERSLYPADKRKSEGASDGGSSKRPFNAYKGSSNETSRKSNPRNHFERSPNSSDKRQSKDVDRPAKVFKGNSNNRDKPVNKTTPRFKKDNQLAKNNNNKNSNPKANKPKHLKRKMHQLSKTIAEGNHRAETDIISVLEGRMQQLAEQMQEFKRLKQKGKDVQDTQSPDGEFKDSGGKELRTIDNGDQIQQIQRDSNDVSATFHQGTTVPKSEKIRTSPSPSNTSDDDFSSDEDLNVESSNARSRGKRRRGQRDVTGRRSDNSGRTAIKGYEKSIVNPIPHAPEENQGKTPTEAGDTSAATLGDASGSLTIKMTTKDDKRRCIGRKPVTDFVIGKLFPGKVKYIKPKLGAFIDIGSHSDAFCHISCTSDTFVSSVTDVLKVDDSVTVRVVEIDREKKRITVSLRSEDVANNEQEKLKTTRQYEHGIKGRDEKGGYSETNLEKEGFAMDKSSTIKSAGTSEDLTHYASSIRNTGHPSISDSANSIGDMKRERKIARRAERRAQNEQQTLGPAIDDLKEGQVLNEMCSTAPTGQSGIDLKRERKLARRAERRVAMEAVNGSA